MKTFKEFISETKISGYVATSGLPVESKMNGYVDPIEGKTPSGNTPIQNISKKSKEIKTKAVRGFLRQYNKKYGGRFAAHMDDNNLDIYRYSRN